MFFDIFHELCKIKGVSCKKAAEEIGLSNSITTKWKKTGATPGGETLEKVAAYFGVSTDYLLGKEEQKEKPLVNGDEELTEYLEVLKTRPEMRMLFQLSKDATKEDVEAAVRIIEALRKK
ncbi:MAG: helix-turn-helix transcriptional regulator [Oscillospiraceae bacterium]|nr:helix-turn-helix transcriptional regulator [Oscillospiraceae bacterium]